MAKENRRIFGKICRFFMKCNDSAWPARYPDSLRRRVFKIKKSLCAVLSQITWQLRRCPCKGHISLAGLAPQ